MAMRQQPAAEAGSARPKDGRRHADVSSQTLQVDRVWFTADRAAAYLDYTGPHAATNFREFAREKPIPSFRRGRRLLFHISDLDAAVGARPVRKRG